MGGAKSSYFGSQILIRRVAKEESDHVYFSFVERSHRSLAPFLFTLEFSSCEKDNNCSLTAQWRGSRRCFYWWGTCVYFGGFLLKVSLFLVLRKIKSCSHQNQTTNFRKVSLLITKNTLFIYRLAETSSSQWPNKCY